MQREQKSRLSDTSKALIAHIRKHGPQNIRQLAIATGEASGDLGKRLRNLCTSGWLEKVERPNTLPTWQLRGAAVDLFGTTKAPSKLRKEPPPMGEMPKPRQINVMNSKYEPEPFTPPRAGSQDFRRISSHGLRC